MKLFISYLLTFVSCLSLFSAESYTVETIPNLRLKDRLNHVSNPDGILSLSDVQAINSHLNILEDSLAIEVAVVAVNSIGEADPRVFATDLFKYWGLGKKGEDNGLLILLTLDPRAVVFETGYGLEGVLPDAICYRLQQKYMIPSLKENKFSEGMLFGVEAVSDYLLASSYEKKTMLTPATRQTGFTAKEKAAMKLWLMIYLGLCVVVGFYIARQLSTINKRYTTLNAVQILQKTEISFRNWGIFAAILFLPCFPFLFLWYKWYKQLLKQRTAVCPQCGGHHFKKLSEKDEMPYLNPQEQCENDLKSIDHTVYRCDDCSHIFKIATEPLFSRYSICPRCGTKAFYSLGEHTVVRATQHSTGISEEKFACKMCNHTEKRRKEIDRLMSDGAVLGGIGGALLGGGGRSSGGFGGGSWGGGSSGGGGSISRF